MWSVYTMEYYSTTKKWIKFCQKKPLSYNICWTTAKCSSSSIPDFVINQTPTAHNFMFCISTSSHLLDFWNCFEMLPPSVNLTSEDWFNTITFAWLKILSSWAQEARFFITDHLHFYLFSHMSHTHTHTQAQWLTWCLNPLRHI